GMVCAHPATRDRPSPRHAVPRPDAQPHLLLPRSPYPLLEEQTDYRSEGCPGVVAFRPSPGDILPLSSIMPSSRFFLQGASVLLLTCGLATAQQLPEAPSAQGASQKPAPTKPAESSPPQSPAAQTAPQN